MSLTDRSNLRPAIFFDRDNTLIVSDGYLGDPDKVVLVDGAADAVARARAMGFAVVVFSNQSGVARGLFDEGAVHAVNARLEEVLKSQNSDAIVDLHEFCPFHPDGVVEAYRKESDLRKPKPGMIHKAAEKLGLDLKKSWSIGDAPRDVEAGHAAGCRTILFYDPKLPLSPAAHAPRLVEPEFQTATLAEAMDYIEKNRNPESSDGGSSSLAPESTAPDPDDAFDEDDDEPATQSLQPVAPATTPPSTVDVSRLEGTLKQILDELRRRDQHATQDFSVSKLLAGVVQVMALGALFMSYFKRDSASALQSTLLLALVLQTLTIALLMMGREK